MLNGFARNPDSIWYENPMLIKQFIEQRADYEALHAEVVYILTKRLKKYRIEYSMVSGRAKTLSSFLDKIQRKNYLNPFEDIKDLAAVRVVCLYKMYILMFCPRYSKRQRTR
jgi:putative GTP pyrophosphokinase